MDEIPAYLLSEWIAYYTIEPFGEERADIRAAITDITIAAAAPNRKRGAKLPKIEEFMPRFDGDGKREQSVEQMIQAAAAFTVAAGGTIGEK